MSHREERGQDQKSGIILDLQVANPFQSLCGRDAYIELRSLMSPKYLIANPYKDIRLAIQNYISPKKRVVTAERAKFLSERQAVGESSDVFLVRLREESRNCDFGKLKSVTKPEEELMKIYLTSRLRDPEAKLRLLDGIKEAKPEMWLTEMTENLQFRCQAMAFASYSSGNQPFNVKQELGYNIQKTFPKPNKKFTANESNDMSTRVGGRTHASVDPVRP